MRGLNVSLSLQLVLPVLVILPVLLVLAWIFVPNMVERNARDAAVGYRGLHERGLPRGRR